MNLSQIVSQIAFRLGNKKNLDQQIENEIRFAQNELERDPKLNLYFLFRSFTFQSYPTDRTYPLPNDFVKMSEMHQPFFQYPNGTIAELRRMPADKIFRPEVSVSPCFYGLEALMFITDVSLDGIYRIFYYASDAELGGSVLENNWTRFASGVLMLRAAMNVAKTLRDMELFNTLYAEYQVSYKDLHDMCVAQEDVGFNIARGDFQ